MDQVSASSKLRFTIYEVRKRLIVRVRLMERKGGLKTLPSIGTEGGS